jgi:ABC-type arginine/histidine transport system permease subunit
MKIVLTSGKPQTILFFIISMMNGAAIALPERLAMPTFHAFSRSLVLAYTRIIRKTMYAELMI